MHSTAHRTTSVSNVCKNCLYHLGPHNRFHFLFPFTSSLKLFALSLMLVPLFETFTQLIFTSHKISTSVTPKLGHLAAKILESFKTRYEIIYVHWVDQLEMTHTSVGHVNRQHQRFTVLPPILMYKRQKMYIPQKQKGRPISHHVTCRKGAICWVIGLAWNFLRQYISWEQSKQPSWSDLIRPRVSSTG